MKRTSERCKSVRGLKYRMSGWHDRTGRKINIILRKDIIHPSSAEGLCRALVSCDGCKQVIGSTPFRRQSEDTEESPCVRFASQLLNIRQERPIFYRSFSARPGLSFGLLRQNWSAGDERSPHRSPAPPGLVLLYSSATSLSLFQMRVITHQHATKETLFDSTIECEFFLQVFCS